MVSPHKGSARRIDQHQRRFPEVYEFVPKWHQWGTEDKFNLMLYGYSKNIARSALEEIIARGPVYGWPIGKIYLVGTDRGREVRRNDAEQNQLRANTSFREHPFERPTIIACEQDGILDALADTQLVIFTAAKQPRERIPKRKQLSALNLDIITDFAEKLEKIGGEYSGLINIVTNQPEVLAQYAASTFPLKDPRQIMANLPIDVARARHLIESYFPDMTVERNEPLVVGTHDHPVLVIPNESVWVNGQDVSEYVNAQRDVLQHLLRNAAWQSLRKGEAEFNQFWNDLISETEKIDPALATRIEQEDIKATIRRSSLRFPTAAETGSAIQSLIEAFSRGSTTTCAVPIQATNKLLDESKDENWYFINLPITFEYNLLPTIDSRAAILLDDDHIEECKELRSGIFGDDELNDSLKATCEELLEPHQRRITISEQSLESRLFMKKRETPARMPAPQKSIGKRTPWPELLYVPEDDVLQVVALDPTEGAERTIINLTIEGRVDQYSRIEHILASDQHIFVASLTAKGSDVLAYWSRYNWDGKQASLGRQSAIQIDNHRLRLLTAQENSVVADQNLYFIAQWCNQSVGGAGCLVRWDFEEDRFASLDISSASGDTLLGLIRTDDELIAGGERYLYKIHKDSLKRWRKTPIPAQRLFSADKTLFVSGTKNTQTSMQTIAYDINSSDQPEAHNFHLLDTKALGRRGAFETIDMISLDDTTLLRRSQYGRSSDFPRHPLKQMMASTRSTEWAHYYNNSNILALEETKDGNFLVSRRDKSLTLKEESKIQCLDPYIFAIR